MLFQIDVGFQVQELFLVLIEGCKILDLNNILGLGDETKRPRKNYNVFKDSTPWRHKDCFTQIPKGTDAKPSLKIGS